MNIIGEHSANHLGPYELRGELGRGAMARVWRAWDPNLEREVAIKEPLFDSSLSEATLEEMGRRFVKEGKAAARLNHPNIVTIHAADVYDGRPAIVMELVDGTTLSGLLDKCRLSPEEALSLLDQLLDAIGYAHENGIVHRDIKPDNIFVSSRGDVKLADFGIAHVADSGATRATMIGTVLGTPGYMSPEQAAGRPVDARSDLFSVAVVAYEMLTGDNPFNRDGADPIRLLYRIEHKPAPELPDSVSKGLPADIRPALMAALAKDPQDRPQTASEFKAMLHGKAVLPSSDDSPSKKTKWVPYIAVAGVAALALIAMFASAGISGGGIGITASTGSSELQATSANTTPENEAPYYVSVFDGYVAIFETAQPDAPYQMSNLAVGDLDAQTAADLGAHISTDSMDEAKEVIESLREKASSSGTALAGNNPTDEIDYETIANDFAKAWYGDVYLEGDEVISSESGIAARCTPFIDKNSSIYDEFASADVQAFLVDGEMKYTSDSRFARPFYREVFFGSESSLIDDKTCSVEIYHHGVQNDVNREMFGRLSTEVMTDRAEITFNDEGLIVDVSLIDVGGL